MPKITLKESPYRFVVFKHALKKFIVIVKNDNLAGAIARRDNYAPWNGQDVSSLTSNLVPFKFNVENSTFKNDVFKRPNNELTPQELELKKHSASHGKYDFASYLLWQQAYNEENPEYNDEIDESKRVQITEHCDVNGKGSVVLDIIFNKKRKNIKRYKFSNMKEYKNAFNKSVILENQINNKLSNKMKKSQLKEMIKGMMREEMTKMNQPQRSTPSRDPVTIPKKPGTKPDVKPRRRTLQPPIESPDTKPKAEGVVDKISQRFAKLKSMDENIEKPKCTCKHK
jgi:hypothetical protein